MVVWKISDTILSRFLKVFTETALREVTMLRALLVFALGSILLSAPAFAGDLTINAFAGQWKGNAISESNVSEAFRLTSRDIDIELRPTAKGFILSWKTVQRQKGDPTNPKEVLKSKEMSFVAVRPGVWRAEGGADPLASDRAFVWSHIEGQTLVTNSLQIYPDGRHELQIYRRTLLGLGMELAFVRFVEGKVVRRAKGRLIKFAN
jgi:hypothetical protein